VTDPGRYRVTLTMGEQPLMHGWWNLEATARRKFTAAVGDYGRDGATVALVDTETGETLDFWPEPVVSADS
jgi:hypothetical protein